MSNAYTLAFALAPIKFRDVAILIEIFGLTSRPNMNCLPSDHKFSGQFFTSRYLCHLSWASLFLTSSAPLGSSSCPGAIVAKASVFAAAFSSHCFPAIPTLFHRLSLGFGGLAPSWVDWVAQFDSNLPRADVDSPRGVEPFLVEQSTRGSKAEIG